MFYCPAHLIEYGVYECSSKSFSSLSTMRKIEIRKKIWDLLEERDVARFPRPVHGRIPNFIGAGKAAERLGKLEEWRNASIIKANPDSPQRWVREKALEENKIVYMAVPRLRKEKCFLKIKSAMGKKASTIKGAFRYGREVFPWEMEKIDLMVMGSVAVNLNGARVGKGGGYSDLEYAIGRECGIIDDETTIATTVHELQVVDHQIPMEKHDVPIDYVVTPERAIKTKTSYQKPRGIEWNILGNIMDEIPILKKIGKDYKRNPI